MGKTLILTEKPSVAEDIAKSFGNNYEKKAGYIVASNGYYITWAFGHLFELDDTAYASSKWVLEELPIFPEAFKYKVVQDKKTQFSNISNLLKDCDRLIVSTDAGREGELIAREILISAGWKNYDNAYRFWTSEALSVEVVKRELQNVKPLKNYDSLYFSAKARQESDWLVGVNLTRLISIKANGRWSVGRVQTPTLNLIVSRDNLIDNFKPEEYYIIKALFEKQGIIFEGKYFNNTISDDNNDEESNKFRLTKEIALQISEAIKTNKTALVKDIKKETKKQNPPPIHSLTSLQRAANKMYGFSAKQTLDIAQGLYEKAKCISYPRTDSNYLADSSKEMVKEKLSIFAPHLISKVDVVGKKVFDNTKLTDHHAIIPVQEYTGQDDKEQKLFDLIKKTFIATFMDEYIYEATTVILTINQYHFISTGKRELQKGWKSLYGDSEEEKESKLPELLQNENVNLNKSNYVQQYTKAPSRLTEDTLLQQMEKLNLGTPATRASIIEKLLYVQYIIRDKKNIISTAKGKELILVLKESEIISPEMTMDWESRLDSIYTQQKGYIDYQTFIGDIKKFVSKEIQSHQNTDVKQIRTATPKMLDLAKKLMKQNNVKGVDFKDAEYEKVSAFITQQMEKAKEGIECPICKGTITSSLYTYECAGCNKKVYKEYAKKKLTQAEALKLLSGAEVLIKGMTSSKDSSKKYDAKLKLKDEKGGVAYNFN